MWFCRNIELLLNMAENPVQSHVLGTVRPSEPALVLRQFLGGWYLSSTV